LEVPAEVHTIFEDIGEGVGELGALALGECARAGGDGAGEGGVDHAPNDDGIGCPGEGFLLLDPRPSDRPGEADHAIDGELQHHLGRARIGIDLGGDGGAGADLTRIQCTRGAERLCRLGGRKASPFEGHGQRFAPPDGIDGGAPAGSDGNTRPRRQNTGRGALFDGTSQRDSSRSDAQATGGDEQLTRGRQSICLRMNVGISMSSSSALVAGEAGGTRGGRGAAPSHAGRAAGAAGLAAGRPAGNGRTDGALG
jgi:hypothetical protein